MVLLVSILLVPMSVRSKVGVLEPSGTALRAVLAAAWPCAACHSCLVDWNSSVMMGVERDLAGSSEFGHPYSCGGKAFRHMEYRT